VPYNGSSLYSHNEHHDKSVQTFFKLPKLAYSNIDISSSKFKCL
ncbi:12848_t:CDS:2, partial [Dentiscutata erythropus]